MSDFHDQRDVRIQKPRRCDECGRRMLPGTRMRKVAQVFEGDFFSYYTCLDCVAVVDHISRGLEDSREDGPWHGGLVDYVRDYTPDAREDLLQRFPHLRENRDI